MDVTPDDGAHIRVAIDDLQELSRVLQGDLIEPTARHCDRVVMQADQAMPAPRPAQRLLEIGQGLRAQPAARRAGDGAVQQNDAPRAHIDIPADHERVTLERPAHGLGFIMVPRQAQDRHAEGAEDAAEMGVAGRIVLNDIARHEHGIRRPLAGLRVRKRGSKRGQSGNSAERFRLAAVEVRIRKMCDSQCRHVLKSFVPY